MPRAVLNSILSKDASIGKTFQRLRVWIGTRMLTGHLGCVCLVLGAMSSAHGAPGDVERIMTRMELEAKQSAGPFAFYIKGVGTAYGWSNTVLEGQKGRRLFCVPGNHILNASNYAQIAVAEYRKDKVYYDQMDPAPLDAIATALLKGLQSTFPCTGNRP